MGYNKGGTQICFTEESIEFGLSQRELKEGAAPAEVQELELGLFRGEEDLYDYSSTHFSLNFDGARAVVPTGADEAETVFNYHVGAQENWVDAVPTYKTVVYDDLYDGIDLHTFSRHGEMKYEFHVAPGANWSEIQLSYDGIEELSIDADGSLHVQTELGEIVDEGLYIYQVINNEQVAVDGHFVLLDDNTYTFAVMGDCDANAELIIDPRLDWGSYLGGVFDDLAQDVAVDSSGNILVTGKTYSSGWISGDEQNGYVDGFAAKLAPNGDHVWSTYLGGSNWDLGSGIVLDSCENVVITGETKSSDWISGGYDSTKGGDEDGFVVKLNPDGAHLWSTYLGGDGPGDDRGFDVSVDSAGNILIAGDSSSGDWVSGGYDTVSGGIDGFAVKLSPDGDHIWSTFLGGDDSDYAYGIVVDTFGNVLVSGSTRSSEWTSGGYETSFNGDSDGFAVKLSPEGEHLWSTYMGGGSLDHAMGIAVDPWNNALVTGMTWSSGWVSGGYDTSRAGANAFVLKLTPNGEHLWSTYVGGDQSENGRGIAVDAAGNAILTGTTQSTGWTSCGCDSTLGGEFDAFLVKIDPNGSHLWSTLIGGSDGDHGHAVAVNRTGGIVVVGATNSPDWLTGGYDTSHGGDLDAFVVRFQDFQLEPPGDLNGDGYVGSADLDIVRANWGRTVTPGDFASGDACADGVVSSGDLDIVRASWGAGTPPAAAAQAESQDSTLASTPALIGPRRASALDATFSLWRDSNTDRNLSDSDLASLAEVAWLREIEALRSKRKRKDVEQIAVSELVLVRE